MSLPTSKTSNSERSTVAVQAIATVLIANSHLEAFYPIPWMAADGLLGNLLFFFLAGYGLARSWQRSPRPFGDFYWRRLVRLYPSLWCVCLIFQIVWLGVWHKWSWVDYLEGFFFPPEFGFVQQILVYCLPFFFLLKARRPEKTMRMVFFATLAVFVVLALNAVRSMGTDSRLTLGLLDNNMWWVFFFAPMLLGGICGLRSDWEAGCAFGRSAAWFVALFLVYVATKLGMVKGMRLPGGVPLADGFVLLLLLSLAIGLTLVRTVVSIDFQSLLLARPKVRSIVGFLGGITLEIYLLQPFFSYSKRLAGLPFPVNLAAFAAVVLVLSWSIMRLARLLRCGLESAMLGEARPSKTK